MDSGQWGYFSSYRSEYTTESLGNTWSSPIFLASLIQSIVNQRFPRAPYYWLVWDTLSTYITTITMGSGLYRWDKLDIVFHKNNSVTAILHLKNRRSAIDVYQQLITASFSENTGDLTINIDNNKYIFSYQEWQSMFTCFKKWLELYSKSELNWLN